MASVVPKPWSRLLEIRNEGGRKNSEVVFSTSDVEKFSSEVEFSISELFCFRPFSFFFDPPMGVPFGGVPLCTTRTVGSPSLRAVSRCGYWESSPLGTEIVAAFPLWRKRIAVHHPYGQ